MLNALIRARGSQSDVAEARRTRKDVLSGVESGLFMKAVVTGNVSKR